MNKMKRVGSGALAIGLISAAATAGGIGPDVIVGSLPNISNYTAVGGIEAYSIGTTSCNVGDEELNWFSNTNQHPVIAQNLYRYHEGVMMQVGQSWLKHGFFALSGSLCDTCSPTNGTVLGVGCSDPYGSGLNGIQTLLGPRFQVNAFTGFFPYPFANPDGSTGNSIFKRLQANTADILPANVPGARFFLEGHYVTPDDAMAGNGLNNASYRETVISASGSMSFAAGSSTQRELPAIQAWADIDPDATVVNADIPGEGRFHVGTKVFDNGDGTWTYHYAIHNLNSDLSAGSFSVEIPNGVNVTDIGFNDVDYHSGEPFDGTDWASSLSGGALTWVTDLFSANSNANALRWGTMYNFWFTADAAPETTAGTIGLFKTDNVDSITTDVPSPMGAAVCLGDCDNSGAVDFNDLVAMLFEFGGLGAPTETCDADQSGSVDFNDLVTGLFLFGPCP